MSVNQQMSDDGLGEQVLVGSLSDGLPKYLLASRQTSGLGLRELQYADKFTNNNFNGS